MGSTDKVALDECFFQTVCIQFHVARQLEIVGVVESLFTCPGPGVYMGGSYVGGLTLALMGSYTRILRLLHIHLLSQTKTYLFIIT